MRRLASGRGGVQQHPAGVTPDILLYHVLHPTDMERDYWTLNYWQAFATCAEFARDCGAVHLHAEMHQAGQYDAECLLRMGSTA